MQQLALTFASTSLKTFFCSFAVLLACSCFAVGNQEAWLLCQSRTVRVFTHVCFTLHNRHAAVHCSNNSQVSASHACMLQQLAFLFHPLGCCVKVEPPGCPHLRESEVNRACNQGERVLLPRVLDVVSSLLGIYRRGKGATLQGWTSGTLS